MTLGSDSQNPFSLTFPDLRDNASSSSWFLIGMNLLGLAWCGTQMLSGSAFDGLTELICPAWIRKHSRLQTRNNKHNIDKFTHL